MMKMLKHALLAVPLVIGLASPSRAGDTVKNTAQVADFAQTGAQSWSDLQGRAILVEFFAYW